MPTWEECQPRANEYVELSAEQEEMLDQERLAWRKKNRHPVVWTVRIPVSIHSQIESAPKKTLRMDSLCFCTPLGIL